MKRYSQHTRTRSILLGLGMLGLIIPLAGSFLTAQTEPAKKKSRFALFRRDKTSDESPTKSSRQVDARPAVKDASSTTSDEFRMMYVDVTWPQVLNDVARKSGSKLVMGKAPVGRFIRTGREKHTRAEAVQILNAELEAQNFRVVEKGDYLVVMDLRAARAKYTRPEYPVVSQKNAAANNGRYKLIGASSRPKSRSNVRTAVGSNLTPGVIRQTGMQQDNKTFEELTSQREEANAEQVVGLKNQQAADVAKRIYEVFRDRSELVRNGPRGLPSFKVYESMFGDPEDENRKIEFTVAIDRDKNELRLFGKTSGVKDLSSLIRQLDRVDGRSVSLVEDDNANTRYATQLQRQINRLVARPEQGQVFAQNNQPPNQVPANPQDAAGFREDLGALSGNLKGEVQIESLEQLNILVIRGNEDDVAQVERVIARIEELSRGTTPEIHIRTLQHVNSKSMATLLDSVYEQLGELRARGTTGGAQKTVTFLPVIQPNAVLILTSAVEMESVLELVDELDKPVDPESEFQVFPLKNAISSQVVEAITTFYGDEPEGLAARVQAIANVRANSVIVQARPSDMAQVEALITDLDKDESSAISQVKVIKLKNAVAEEMLETLNANVLGAINPASTGTTQRTGAGGQNSSVLQETKSVVLQFLAGDGQELIRSGILADVRFGSDPRTNSILVTAPEASMNLIEALIEELDQASNAVAEIKAFELKNTDASTAVELLQELFDESDSEDGVQVQLAGAEDATSSLIPLRFSFDFRTNTVIAIGGVDSLRVVEAILLRLDESETKQRELYVVKLHNTGADEVAEAVNNFIEAQNSLLESAEGTISEIERLRRDIIVEPEAITNSLLVSADQSQLETINDLIENLDAAPPEIAIQALIVEVQLDNVDEFGMELGFQDSLLFNRSVLENVQTLTDTETVNQTQTTTQRIISSEGTPGFLFNNTSALGNNSGAEGGRAGSVAAQGLSNFSLGRANTDLGFGGFVFSASSGNVSVLLRALAARRNVQVLSRPHITTIENYPASIDVGSQIGVINGVTPPTTTSPAIPVVERETAGIYLAVTPRVTADGVVVMDVEARSNQLTGQGTPVYQDPTTGTVFETPIIDVASVVTRVAVPNGQTVVLGGMITKSDETIERKVPWLGDIPVLGIPFRFDSTSTVRTELLIFLTPRVIRSSADSELIKQIESERMHFIESEAEDLHGPLYSLPPRGGEQIPHADYGGVSVETVVPNRGAPATNSDTMYPPSENTQLPEFPELEQYEQMSGQVDRSKRSVSRADYKRKTR